MDKKLILWVIDLFLKRLVIFVSLLLIFVFFGCSTIYFQPKDPGNDYKWYIKQWQKQEWNESKVDNIVNKCILLSKYEKETFGHDHWKTYNEYLKTFSGDCEDIATFIYGTLKKLNCPYDKRIRIIRMFSGDHAIIVINIPNKGWKKYNTLPITGDFVDISFSRFIVEWDENNIYY